MANVNSVSSSSSSSTSSLYGNRNVITGLATGMDTEAMIENSVSSYKTKITSIQQKQTKIEWQQEGLRSITDKMIELGSKYTSYTSSSNLGSSTFFDSAVKNTTSGTYAAMVSATGKTDNDVKINSVTQLASASTYVVTGAAFGSGSSRAATAIDWDKEITTNHLSGSSMVLSYGDNEGVEIAFGEDDAYADLQGLADGINAKLKEKLGDDTGIQAQLTDGKLSFTGGAHVGEVNGKLASMYSVENEGGQKLAFSDTEFTTSQSMADYLRGKTIDVTMDGVTKSVTLGSTLGEGVALTRDNLVDDINSQLAVAFGSTDGVQKVTASMDGSGQLSIGVDSSLNSSVSVHSSASEALGFSNAGLTSYINTGRKVSELMGDWGDGDSRTLTINNTAIEIGKDDTVAAMISKINSSDAGVTVNYSTVTNEFVFRTKETGAGTAIDLGGGADDLSRALFGGGAATAGKDAILSVTVNGTEERTLTRSGNTVDLDGLNVTLKGTFQARSAEDAVSINTQTDTEKLMSTIKSFVDDYNAIMKETHNAFTTQPQKKSNGAYYEPLTEKDKEGMSDSTIEKYEEKAKAGQLFNDSDLSSMYNEMRSAISGMDLTSIGITAEYDSDSKVTTLRINEEKLRGALESEPDKVKDVFVGSEGKTGLADKTKGIVDKYASTSMAGYGVLVKKAGTAKKSVSLLTNTLQKKIESYDEEISKWETKMNNQIDYYTKMFSQLETLMSTMNNQSSMISGLMGG